MLLSGRMLKNVSNVNDFDFATEVAFSEGDAVSLYVQLIDAERQNNCHGEETVMRYVPASGATLSVTLDSLDDAKKITRAASQPFAGDPSIWRVDLLTTDKCRGTVTLRLALTEGSVTRHGAMRGALRVVGLDSSTLYG